MLVPGVAPGLVEPSRVRNQAPAPMPAPSTAIAVRITSSRLGPGERGGGCGGGTYAGGGGYRVPPVCGGGGAHVGGVVGDRVSAEAQGGGVCDVCVSADAQGGGEPCSRGPQAAWPLSSLGSCSSEPEL